MTLFPKFIGISLVLHLILFFALVDIDLSSTNRDPSLAESVYEVSIVSAKDIRGVGKPIPRPKKVIRSRSKKIEGVGKEHAIAEKTPDFSPKEIEPPVKTEPATQSPEPSEIVRPLDKKRAMEGMSQVSLDQVAIYKAKIKEIIKDYWKVPPELSILERSLKATYMIRIVRNGNVMNKKLIVSSGNKPFDRSILRALDNVNMLPVPPLVLIAGADTLEIVITFTSEELNK
ncbi:MAG: TonB C-terminal domain-containing protein [Deltaproteobacteria bacterium]|nr:TonB C-terminal domain-containing protein [Deltaproteobacteria bacterium]